MKRFSFIVLKDLSSTRKGTVIRIDIYDFRTELFFGDELHSNERCMVSLADLKRHLETKKIKIFKVENEEI
jgi:hypothetical protein